MTAAAASSISTSAPNFPNPPTCSLWGPVKADPDIAGTGVLISFTLSAYLTLFLVIVHYLFDDHVTTNPIDRRFIDFVTPRAWNNSKAVSKKWTKALESAVLLYSDTQVVTGMAILLTGYIQLPSGISSYHWQVIVDLAWFSTLSHLATLTALRGYFPLLATALGPTGYISQFATSAVPAKCLYSPSAYTDITKASRFT
ncbi:hypothetical protein G7Y79_00022g051580 [Physcia stellaris]|nr:hypothetical protein G7Y79_00022g051580 [Physcia stellaris]